MKTESEQEQTLSENLQELKQFLDHIEGRVGEQAHARVCEVLEEAIAQTSQIETYIKSDSVYTLLRFGTKSPSSSGVDDCEEERYYYDLYNISCELRKK